MSFGKMNTFLDIIDTTATKDDEGFVIKGDKILTSVRAYREERHGSKKWANLSTFTGADALFKFRVIPGIEIKPGMVIVCDTGRYTIISIAKVKGFYIEALAKTLEAIDA